jgi:hypothetical protein
MSGQYATRSALERLTVDCPCSDCPSASRCGSERLACLRFAGWHKDGRSHPELPTRPTARLWRTLFKRGTTDV